MSGEDTLKEEKAVGSEIGMAKGKKVVWPKILVPVVGSGESVVEDSLSDVLRTRLVGADEGSVRIY